MKIVALDTHTLSFDGLTLEAFRAYGEFVSYAQSSTEEVILRSADADGVLVNKVSITEAVMQALPKLRYIGVTATGVNNVDLDAARRRGIVVTNVPGYSTESVVQLTVLFILLLATQSHRYLSAVAAGEWQRSEHFAYLQFPLFEVAGKSLGIVGFGHIGRRVAEVARALGMTILAADLPGQTPRQGRIPFLEMVGQADFVSLHCPLTTATQELINEESLRAFKIGSSLINTARGGLINEPALLAALNEGRLHGAALDVLTVEPPLEGNALFASPKVIVTPHIAWATREARLRLVEISCQNLAAFLEQRDCNRVA